MGSAYPTTEWLANQLFAATWFGGTNGSTMILIFLAGLMIASTILLLRRRPSSSLSAMASSPMIEGGTIRTFRHSLPTLSMEITRARRYEGDLAVLVVKLQEDQFLNQQRALLGQDTPAHAHVDLRQTMRIVFLHIGSILRDYLRQSDLPTCDSGNGCYVILLPETDRAEALLAAARIKKLIFEGTGFGVRAGVANFPKEGMVIEDLVENASTDCDRDNIREISELRKMHTLANSAVKSGRRGQADRGGNPA